MRKGSRVDAGRMARILALRFSALGDVVMTLPVLWSFAKQYPDDEVVLLSRPIVAPLFEAMPANVGLWGVDLGKYKGLGGLWKLFKELKKEKFDGVADLHDVIRSRVLSGLLRLSGLPVERIDKDRRERRRLVKSKGRRLKPLLQQEERYRMVFACLGYPFEMKFESLFPIRKRKEPENGRVQIGIAPFAGHPTKVYPREAMERVVELLSLSGKVDVYLFGSGREEQMVCAKWADKYAGVRSMAGKGGGLLAEAEKMSELDAMLTMDSANMHIATLAGVRTLTIWGATHPYAGFGGFRQPGSSDLQVDMDCRPCSIFGSKKCGNRQKLACMRTIAPELVVERLLAVAKESPAALKT